MTPLEDDLRAVLRTRAGSLSTGEDPTGLATFAGVERRAGQLRRRRLAASAAGTVTVVAGLLVAVPLLGSSSDRTAPRPPAAGQGPQSPTPTLTPSPTAAAVEATPANVLPWPALGTPDDLVLAAAEAAFAEGRSAATQQVKVHVLTGGHTGKSRYLLAQMWLARDDTAATVGWVEHGDGTAGELQLLRALTPDTKVAVVDLVEPGGEVLVVVPQPGTGQVLYAGDGTTYAPASDQADGTATAVRAPRATKDRLRLLDGDGRQTFDGSVFLLLCGATSCG